MYPPLEGGEKALKRVLIVGLWRRPTRASDVRWTTLVKVLQQLSHPVEVVAPVYGLDPGDLPDSEAEAGVVSFLHTDMDRLLTALEEARLVVLTGDLLDVGTSGLETLLTPRHAGLVYAAGVPWLAAQLGIPVMLYAVGVDPGIGDTGRLLLRDVCEAARRITARDAVSRQILIDLGGPPERVEVAADLERSAAGALELLGQGPDPWPTGARRRVLEAVRHRARGESITPGSVGWAEGEAARTSIRMAASARRVPSLVRVIAPQFFDPSGQRVIFGGAERYLIELAGVLRDLGADVEVVQMATGGGWERSAFGLRVVGIPAANFFEIEPTLYRAGALRPALTIHLAFWTAGHATLPPSIGISHGVFWDQAYYQRPEHAQFHRARILEAIEALDVLVSVDANTVNWLRTVSVRLTEKCVRIPNFVDLRRYFPGEREDDGRVVVLYPRRLVADRGFWFMAEVIPDLVRDHPHLVVELVGDHAGEAERQAAERLMAEFPGRVRWRTVPFDEMPDVYRAADIVVLPTVYAEGTSLACLEAMACGKAVVATRVGGLPELVIDGYNGLLIEPTAAAVRGALERLIGDPALRTRLGLQAVETVRAFDIVDWRVRWRDVLRTFWVPAESKG
ncbi:D-inositol 3-phosphate glycosyltransferase [bacterium HR11]|nr:D-inositol 3-phosphate glycosyltransferase [bacterium HR11]